MRLEAADEPAYLTVGTDVSAKYRGAFCEAKIKTVKRLVKVKVLLKQDNTTQLVQDDQVKGPLRVGAIVETRTSDGSFQEAIISKLTDARFNLGLHIPLFCKYTELCWQGNIRSSLWIFLFL
uniref:AT-rich interaction domain 4A n=1 Tax=Ursus americanus TaxID=9643 RepID=A0A452QVC8_URSAM